MWSCSERMTSTLFETGVNSVMIVAGEAVPQMMLRAAQRRVKLGRVAQALRIFDRPPLESTMEFFRSEYSPRSLRAPCVAIQW